MIARGKKALATIPFKHAKNCLEAAQKIMELKQGVSIKYDCITTVKEYEKEVLMKRK